MGCGNHGSTQDQEPDRLNHVVNKVVSYYYMLEYVVVMSKNITFMGPGRTAEFVFAHASTDPDAADILVVPTDI